MSNCWAASLGGCGGKISREHLISKSLFTSPMINVEGFHWCKGGPRTVALASLTAKILCQTHNSNLSPLDEEAAALFDGIRNWCQRENQRGNTSPLARLARPATIVRAKLLERWFLKSLVNLSLSRDYFIGADGEEKGVVPRSITQICYGEREFADGAGMYAAGLAGMLIASDDTVQFAPLLRDDRVMGGMFMFRGFRFLLSLMPEQLKTMPALGGAMLDWDNARLLRPIEKIEIELSPLIKVPVIRFNW